MRRVYVAPSLACGRRPLAVRMFPMKFLVTTDGSERSLHVLPHAGRLARSAGATIELARVLDPHNDATHVQAPSRHEAIDRVRATWQGELQAALAAANVP